MLAHIPLPSDMPLRCTPVPSGAATAGAANAAEGPSASSAPAKSISPARRVMWRLVTTRRSSRVMGTSWTVIARRRSPTRGSPSRIRPHLVQSKGPTGLTCRRTRGCDLPARRGRCDLPPRATAYRTNCRAWAGQNPGHRLQGRRCRALGQRHPGGCRAVVSPRRGRPCGRRRWRAAPCRCPEGRSCPPRGRSPGPRAGARPGRSARRAGSSCPETGGSGPST